VVVTVQWAVGLDDWQQDRPQATRCACHGFFPVALFVTYEGEGQSSGSLKQNAVAGCCFRTGYAVHVVQVEVVAFSWVLALHYYPFSTEVELDGPDD
jgi:hypothetical protein